MTAGELKELLKNVPDEREIRVRFSVVTDTGFMEGTAPIFDLGYDGEQDVEVIMAEEK